MLTNQKFVLYQPSLIDNNFACPFSENYRCQILLDLVCITIKITYDDYFTFKHFVLYGDCKDRFWYFSSTSFYLPKRFWRNLGITFQKAKRFLKTMSGPSEVNHNLSVYTVGKNCHLILQFNAKNGHNIICD